MMSSAKKKKWSVTGKATPPGVQNIFEPGPLRSGDQFRVRALATDGRFPFFILSDSGLGYAFSLKFLNGKSWDEGTRSKFLSMLEEGLKRESDESIVEYTYSFTCVRRPFSKDELERHAKDEAFPLSNERVRHLQDLASRLEVQASDFYFGICASPSPGYKGQKVSLRDRVVALFSKKVEYAIESDLLEDLVMEFGDKVKQVLALFARLGIQTNCPKTEKDLLKMTRKAWRPNYEQPGSFVYNQRGENAVDDSLKAKNLTNVGEFLAKDLRIEQYRDFWIADGCFNMLFSLEEAPDPNRIFSSYEADSFLSFGIRPGVNNIPYLGTYTVAWSSMTREEGDARFRMKNAFTRSMTTDQKGIFEDKMAEKEAQEVDQQHDEYITGGSDMVRACVMYQLSIPLEHLDKYFETGVSDEETTRSIRRTVELQLNEIGLSRWRLEDRTYYTSWLNSMPGLLRCADGVQFLPRTYLSLEGTLHLVPFYATVGPESPHDPRAWRGSNYFITDDATPFIFDHFSEHNGTAANFSVCGGTGSGKSVTVQSLVMMTEKLNPYVMILDFGGGNVGSWTKLCSVMGGVELKFGSARPPRINPFQLAEADSYPNSRKKRNIAIALRLPPDDEETHAMIDSVYIYLRSEDSPFTDPIVRHNEIIERCPAFSKITPEAATELLKLAPGLCRPGDKGGASIKVVLELLLSSHVTEDGPTDNVWARFSQDDINEAILRLYDEYQPPKEKPGRWPTLSDFRDSLEKLQTERARRGKTANRWGNGSIANYPLLMTRLSTYCQGGLDPFLDGQTNVDIRRRIIENGTEKEVPAKFILADMAGVSDKRKLALYMIVINDFMSDILYNSKGSRGIMIRDEAWLFMRSKIASPYLEADYRLARKYGFSVITIAQQYSDFVNPVLQNNTQTWIICSLGSKEEVSMAHARFKFNDAEIELFENNLMGLKTERDVFSGRLMESYARIMIATQSGKYFVKNKVGKSELWITTTNADETFVYNYVKDTILRGKPPIEIIKWLVSGAHKDKNAPYFEKLDAAIATAGRKWPKI